MIDLRSDTVTRPTAAMRQVMLRAEVGDDVIDRDPTVHRLQQAVADVLGKEQALFMPSGTMTNQVALRVHCRPGDEFLCDADCHIYNYEQGAFAQLSGLVARTIQAPAGRLAWHQLHDEIRPDNEHLVRTRLVCIENTHNRGGGSVQDRHEVERICEWAQEHGLGTHLDGARLFNAAVASGTTVTELAQPFDTVSVCFSKGLGAPVGSVLAGPEELIRRARRARKLFGGGMRQSGILAAAALYALQHHVQRLSEDHEHARLIESAVGNSPHLKLRTPVETNIVLFDVDPAWGSATDFVDRLAEQGVGVLTLGKQSVRVVTHLDVSADQCRQAAKAILRVAAQPG